MANDWVVVAGFCIFDGFLRFVVINVFVLIESYILVEETKEAQGKYRAPDIV